MTHVNWLEFLNLLPFTIVGLVIHCLRQLKRAKQRPDYLWKIFIKLNGLGYVIALLTSLLCLAGLSAGLDKMTFKEAVLSAAGIGITGGTLMRKIGGGSGNG